MSTSFFEGVLSNAVCRVHRSFTQPWARDRRALGNREPGLEGVMLVAPSLALSLRRDQQSLIAVPAAALAGAAFNMLFAYIVVTRRGNQLASGLTLMFLLSVSLRSSASPTSGNLLALEGPSHPGLATCRK